MFRKVTLVVAAGLVTVLAVATGVAGASPDQVIFISGNNGPIAFAEAAWETRTPTSITDAFVLTAKTHRDGPGTGREGGGTTHIFVELRTTYLDASGHPIGGVDMAGGAAGVPQTFDEAGLTTASVSATVPVTRCILDAASNPTSCEDGGTLRASADWIGEGPIFQGSFYEDHFHVPNSFVFIDRASGKIRLANASATIGDQFFDLSSQQFADMGVNVQLTALICPHGC